MLPPLGAGIQGSGGGLEGDKKTAWGLREPPEKRHGGSAVGQKNGMPLKTAAVFQGVGDPRGAKNGIEQAQIGGMGSGWATDDQA